MKCKRKFMVAVLLMSAVMLSGSVELFPSGVAFANSANREYRGYDSSGVIVTTENCPIVVDKEVLTFNIPNSTASDSAYVGSRVAYKGNVTAEYTFRNPSELTAEVHCVFPFGFPPVGETDALPGKDVFAVKKNGVDLNPKVRLTYKRFNYGSFELDNDLQQLADDYISDGSLTTETPVYEYEITVGEGRDKVVPAFVRYTYKYNNSEITPLVCDAEASKRIYADKTITFTKKVGDDGKMSLAYIGEAVKITEYDFDLLDEKQKLIDGSVDIEQKPARKLKDFVLEYKNSGIGASDIDWFNASVNMLQSRRTVFKSDLLLKGCLFYWFDYTLTFAPDETLTNTVTAPMYPTVNAWYEPNKYEFTYLLSPASTWADFNDLTICINTDMYLLDSGTQRQTLSSEGYGRMEKQNIEFQSGEGSFQTLFDKLPDGELVFTLCSVENPDRYNAYVFGKRCA